MNSTGSARSNITALGQVASSLRSHSATGVIEVFQRFHTRQMSFANASLNGVSFPLFGLGQQQGFQISHRVFFSRIACSASLPNCEAIIGIPRKLFIAMGNIEKAFR